MELLTSSMVLAVPEMGCSPLDNTERMAGNIAVINRGACTFVEKVRNAQAAGAVAVVITDNRIDPLVKMTGDYP
jgi:3-hydroxy-3-methylglutaryl CoA synthase